MDESRVDDAAGGPVVSGGGRGPSTLSTGQGAPSAGSGATLGPLAPGRRWSAARKREVVLRLMRGESPSCSRASWACRCSGLSSGGRGPKPPSRAP